MFGAEQTKGSSGLVLWNGLSDSSMRLTMSFIHFFLVLNVLLSSATPCPDDGNHSYGDLTSVPPYQPGCDYLTLNLVGNYINIIASGDFEGFLNLRRFVASNNLVVTVEEGAFADAIHLTVIDLSENNICCLNQSFKGARSLSDVHLEHNEIRHLDSNVFYGAPAIELIDLSHNQISDINGTAFANNHLLRTLKLAYNRIRSLPETLFRFNAKLGNIDLSNNRIAVLSPNLFANLNYLTDLKLTSNSLAYINLELSSPDLFLHADNCGLVDVPEISSVGVVEIDLRDNMVECGCYILERINRTLRCVDEESGQYSDASCFSEDTTTIPSAVSTENKQTTSELGEPDKQTDTRPSSLWYVLPTLVVAMIVIGLVAVFVYRHKRRNLTDGHSQASQPV